MIIEDKLALIEEALDVEENSLKPETVLKEIDEWDSMSALSLIVMLDDEFEKTVTGAEVRAMRTVSDILTYME